MRGIVSLLICSILYCDLARADEVPARSLARVTERVGCAGLLTKSAPGPSSVASPALSREYVIGDRTVRIDLTPATHFQEPWADGYLEFPMANDRVPIFSARIRPAARYWWERALRAAARFGLKTATGARETVRFALPPGRDLDSLIIADFARQLTERGYTDASLDDRDFNVRIDAIQFSGREFWRTIVPRGARRNLVSLSAERGFDAAGAGELANVISQAQTWMPRGLLLWSTVEMVVNMAAPGTLAPTIPAGEYLASLAAIGIAGSLLHDAVLPAAYGRAYLRPFRILAYVLPDLRGLLNSAQLPIVRQRRHRVLVDNVTAAVAAHPDMSVVQIITESKADLAPIDRIFAERFETAAARSERIERASYGEPDPMFDRFPGGLRGKALNLEHRPTRELVEVLKTTFAPRVFRSAADFIAYYRPDRVPGWADGRHDWTYEQYVAIYLFDSLRWSLPQFFAFVPEPAEIRALMNIPSDHFDRKQLHEFPSGNAVHDTLVLIAARAEEMLKSDPDRRDSALVDIKPLPESGWKLLSETLRRPGAIAAWAAEVDRAIRPPPPSFTSIPENMPPLTPGRVDRAKFPYPEDGW